jgi:DNA-binding LacI/PurR family transcriptional regulator
MTDPSVVYAISAKSLVQPRTVARILGGGSCKPVTRARIEQAAAELGLKIPRSPKAPTAPARGRTRVTR